MKKLIQALALLLVAALCLSLCGMTAWAETTKEPEEILLPTQDSGWIVTAIKDNDTLSSIAVKTVFPNSELQEIYKLASTMQTVSATVEKNGIVNTQTLGVDWDLRGIDTTTVGLYAAVGTILVPEGYRFADGVMTQIHIPVQVAVPLEPVVITSIESWYPHTDAQAILQGSKEDLDTYFQNLFVWIKCYDANGGLYTTLIEWDSSGIDISTVGLYQAVGTFQPPAYTIFAEGLTLPTPTVPISVQADGKPDINCFFTGRGEFRFPWVTPPGELSAVSAWLSENDGAWRKLQEGIYVGNEHFALSTSQLTKGNNYRLQVDYEGGQTGILTFIYGDTILVNNYSQGDRDGGDADGSVPDEGDTVQKPPASNGGGNSNGSGNNNGSGTDHDTESGNESDSGEADGDREETEVISPPVTTPPITLKPTPLPELPAQPQPPAKTETTPPTQTPPLTVESPPTEKPTRTPPPVQTVPPTQSQSPPQTDEPSIPVMVEPSPEADGFLEVFGENRDLISGTRLLLMLKTTGEARFTKQGVTVCFSVEALDAQNIQDSDRIEIIIEREAENMVFLTISINDVPLSALPNTRLMMPYRAANADTAFLLTNEQDEEVSRGEYDTELAVVSFRVNAPGQFTIIEQVTVPQPTAASVDSKPQAQEDSGLTFWSILLLGGMLLVVGDWFFLKRRRSK